MHGDEGSIDQNVSLHTEMISIKVVVGGKSIWLPIVCRRGEGGWGGVFNQSRVGIGGDEADAIGQFVNQKFKFKRRKSIK